MLEHCHCRACGEPLRHTFCDLGLSPISNAFIQPDDSRRGEIFYPLQAFVCNHCWLVQLEDFERAENLFNDDYAYFSSYSESWLAHAKRYVDMVIPRFGLGPDSRVVEVASNDGYLLRNFVAAGIPCLGIEPTANTAAAARAQGIHCRELFFGKEAARQLAEEGWQADLILGNNVLAHVPDINDFVSGFKRLLKPGGLVTLEFPHLLNLIRETQFDTLYHEHFSYLSLTALQPIFTRAGLRCFDVETLPTHGGSLRVFLTHQEDTGHRTNDSVSRMLEEEVRNGLTRIETYARFGEAIRTIKRDLLDFLITAKRQGKRIAAYGAAAKGNTLLNYCGIRTDFIDCVADRNPGKQGRLTPGTRIPVISPEAMLATRPDYLLILPWNLREEIVAQMTEIQNWGGQFVVPIPSLTTL